ncbi:bifunctional 3,4-dihydroxy-2-butanone-4-phosphate synthase/GTP cyclohydrolase II [Patescibacteria group bacterium]|nr:bifunctional 3,4-dihydroxy-2-butanone-4-phosphate synthase/GTP cyclohydrolase II [Patescibacteria group bacterium]MBU1124083.1 bifunctional 3,4-dihydroxy-2-butanone-4-phosphate synthase/GTP cyclohydrolase II [Patescibacteria group bacterium]MBU1911543.1 bifunctional 3,4-dihydroxy-2-butanone-4-phosphate synthase/GTP cyclohydrolase II [Patescibacteria group bacterium]
MQPFSPIPHALDHLRSGGMIIVVDDEDRENEGDLIIAAESITEEKMAFIIRYTGGVVCLPLNNAIADQLNLPNMVNENTSKHNTPFTVSIDAVDGITTGISAYDRSITVRRVINPVARPEDFVRPGHIFPLRAHDGGVLVRAGHTEAAIDLCVLSGLRHGAVLSELMNDDGTMMRLDSLQEFSKKHCLPLITIADLIAWRQRTEIFVRKEATSNLETDTGAWQMHVFTDTLTKDEHVALVKGHISKNQPALVRVHSECLTGDTFHSKHCDCGEQLKIAMEKISSEGAGVILYMRQEGRGIGLTNKIRAYELQQQEGLDTVEANTRLGFKEDLREYGIGAQILKELGISHLRLLTNNPKKIVGLEGYGLHVIEQIPIELNSLNEMQKKYLFVKKVKLGHKLKGV